RGRRSRRSREAELRPHLPQGANPVRLRKKLGIAQPVPLRSTRCALFSALSRISRTPALTPTEKGTNVTSTRHELPESSVVPQCDDARKLPEAVTDPMIT